MKTIKEVTNNSAILRFVEHNNKKFKLTYDNRNGTPLVFYRFKAKINMILVIQYQKKLYFI